MISLPAAIPWSPRATAGAISSQASGAPSLPCFGASGRVLRGDRITPIGVMGTVFPASCFMSGSALPAEGASRGRPVYTNRGTSSIHRFIWA